MQWCRSLLSIGGYNLQFYFNIGGDEPRPRFLLLFRCGNLVKTKRKMQTEHFFFPNSGEDQKKRSSARMEHFFSKFSLSCTLIQIIGGMQVWTILKLLGGYSQIIVGIYPLLPPRVLAPLVVLYLS